MKNSTGLQMFDIINIRCCRKPSEATVKRSAELLFLFRSFVVLLLVLFSFGCYPTASVPIDSVHYDAKNAQRPRLLIIYLPGRGDSMSVFQKEGLVEAVRERGLPADIIAVNAHIGYYINGSMLTRLKEDVINPAKAKGYEQIWMVGNSLGGYGSISYTRENPNDVTGVVLLGPYLGGKTLMNEIKQAGGLQKWDAREIKNNSQEYWDKHLWLWLKDCERLKGCYPKIYLGYGRDDRFSYSQDFLASLMPPEHVITIDGGHDWRTWKKLWLLLIRKNIFQVNTVKAAPVEVKL